MTDDEVRQAAREAADEIRRQRERIAELEAALRPFAALGARMLAPDSSRMHAVRVSVDDVRAAQRALLHK